MVEPISSGEATRGCLEQLQEAILDGEIGVGSRLPPERELSRRLDVNRITLRQALAQLKAAGLLSVRQGSGYLVRDFYRSGGIELLAPLLALPSRRGRAAAVVADLLRVRRALARVLLERLAERPPSTVETIRDAVDGFEHAVRQRRPPDELADIDLDVVAALAGATGSEVLRLCVNSVARILTQLPALQRALYRDPERNLSAFRALVTWLERGAPAEVIEPVIATMEDLDRDTVKSFRRELKRQPEIEP